jgi:nucleoside-diphosphate-sugar epimerase
VVASPSLSDTFAYEPKERGHSFNMRILVTGAAGFIGSHLSERLLREGHRVAGIDCFSAYYDRAIKERNAEGAVALGLELHEIDLAQDPLEALCADAEVVFHAAAQPGISAETPFTDYLRNNVVATHRLVEAAAQGDRLSLFVNIATSSIYGSDATGPETVEPRPTSYYGVTKLAAEQRVLAEQREHGFPGCSLRLFSVYGPRERPEKLFPRLIHSIAEEKPFPLYGEAEQHTRSFTYVDDVVEGMVACIAHAERMRGEIVNIGSSIQKSTGEAIRIVEQLMGRRARMDRRPRRTGDQQDTRADVRKAQALLGYAPHTTPERGLEATVAWFSRRDAR